MKNHEICRFVNSKDIRQHLLEIKYNFTTTEAAWLVSQCQNITLDEKINAWKDIIKTMPDQPLDSRKISLQNKSIHEVISCFIEQKKKVSEIFFTVNQKSFYQYILLDGRGYSEPMLYSSYENCFNQLHQELAKYEAESVTGKIIRSELDCSYTIHAYYNHNFQIKDFEIYGNLGEPDLNLLTFFEDLWLPFPVPFKKGDILYNPYEYNSSISPIVMTDITPLKYESDGRRHADNTDMNVWGYFCDKVNGTIYWDVTWNYMDFEYFPKEKLTGKNRILKALSNLLKEKIDIELFIRAYHLIILEETQNDLMPYWIKKECLRLAGLRS